MKGRIIPISPNYGPMNDFEGFSPSEMHQIIYYPYKEKGPISINRSLLPDFLRANSPIYSLLLHYLILLKEELEIKLTKTGRLPRNPLNALYDLKILPDDMIETGITKLTTQGDWVGFYSLFYTCELAGLTKKRNGKLSLTKKGHKLLESANQKPALFYCFLEAYTTKFNMGCFDGYDDNGCGQTGFLFMLWLIQKFGASIKQHDFYIKKYFKAFPTFLGADETRFIFHSFETRFFTRFCNYFGFIDTIDKYTEKENYTTVWKIASSELLAALIET